MLRLIIDFVNEYQDAIDRRSYIGNERIAEFESAFSEMLEGIINSRIWASKQLECGNQGEGETI